jgi:hypothetical protein
MLKTFLSHGSNGALVLGVTALVASSGLGKGELAPGWVVIGALLFYTSEYSWHRFVFHARPPRFAVLRRLQHRLHYDHHAEPSRLDLLFLPLWFLVPNLVVTGAILGLVLGTARMPATLLGVMLAILHYEWVHFIAHVPHTPRTRFGRWMKQYHLRHHFISETSWFGVSNPSFDLLRRIVRPARCV